MDVTRLPVGEEAPQDSDCIVVTRTSAGHYELECSVLADVTGDVVESMSVIGSDPYPTYEAAEAAGLALVGPRNIQQVYVSRIE